MDDVILCNRSASYLALKRSVFKVLSLIVKDFYLRKCNALLYRYIPASHDALQASKVNPDNWKSHWRQGVSIMHMAPRKFRTKQAIAAFERCSQCSTLPENKQTEVQKAIRDSKARLEAQDANVSIFYL